MKPLLAAALVTLATLSAAPARAATIADIGAFAETRQAVCDSTVAAGRLVLCVLPFSAVPADKVLEVRYVSCNYGLQIGAVPIRATLAGMLGTVGLDIQADRFRQQSGEFQTHQPVTAFVPSGVAPHIVLRYLASANRSIAPQFSCSLIGEFRQGRL